MDDEEERKSSLAMDIVIPGLVRQKIPITLDNWLSRAGYDRDELEDAEVLSSVPWELMELEEGEVIHPWRYYDAVAQLPDGITPPGGPVDRTQLFWARVRLWFRSLLNKRS